MIIYRIFNKINGKSYIGQSLFDFNEYWYVFVDLNDWNTSSYLCDTLKGVDQLIGSFAKKQPTRFNKLKSKIKKFLEN